MKRRPVDGTSFNWKSTPRPYYSKKTDLPEDDTVIKYLNSYDNSSFRRPLPLKYSKLNSYNTNHKGQIRQV
jgi:hypothetical protein